MTNKIAWFPAWFLAWFLVFAAAGGLGGCWGRAERRGGPEPTTATAVTTQPAPPAAPRRHLLMVVELEAGQGRVLVARGVDVPLPQKRVADPGPWRVEILATDGRSLYAATLPEAGVVRGEVAGPGGTLESVNAHQPRVAVTLRLPTLASVPDAASVRIFGTDATHPDVVGPLGTVPYPREVP